MLCHASSRALPITPIRSGLPPISDTALRPPEGDHCVPEARIWESSQRICKSIRPNTPSPQLQPTVTNISPGPLLLEQPGGATSLAVGASEHVPKTGTARMTSGLGKALEDEGRESPLVSVIEPMNHGYIRSSQRLGNFDGQEETALATALASLGSVPSPFNPANSVAHSIQGDHHSRQYD